MSDVNIIWFRHGLRLHDNPALLEAIKSQGNGKRVTLLPMFIFDGETAGTKIVGYNRMRFLLESLEDLDKKLRLEGGQLYIFKGNPVNIFSRLHEEVMISKICYEQDCEPIWQNRDNSVTTFCHEQAIECIERVSHTLWDPMLVVKTNGGIPPLTYQMFLHTVQIIGPPSRPVENPEWSGVEFFELADHLQVELNVFKKFPAPEDFGVFQENTELVSVVKWKGGETQALLNLYQRLHVEKEAFRRGLYLPNQACPNILESPTSMSAHLRFGCLSVRKFYWDVHDLFNESQKEHGYIFPDGPHITGQLVWREYFYTMSVTNPNFASMEGNDICLKIPWAVPSDCDLDKWKYGRTGFPLIDAAMRQLLAEGWLHHTLRNATATFLTRGGLWISWEHGLQHFLKYLLDADWSVCAGNWMWVSSSAFEKLLDSSQCTCPTALARRLDPNGEYICRYVPELSALPKEYIHEPWNTPDEVQRQVGCVIGVDYPKRLIDFAQASKRNNAAMKVLRDALLGREDNLPHCRPSNDEEIRHFFWLSS